MPRENSFTDSEGRSLTPDLEDMDPDSEALGGAPPISPTYSFNPSQAFEPNSAAAHAVTSASKHSLRSRATGHAAAYSRNGFTPRERFRASVRKVMAMHRSATLISGGAGRIGAEPGVDPRRASADALYSHIKQDCVIEVVDYSSVRSSFSRMTNREFIDLMGDPSASVREPWVKVRWINIGGLSWDVIKAVSIKYGLHPLALEDVFTTRSQNRSKADYYLKHLFLRVLCHELSDPDEVAPLTDAARSTSPEPIHEDENMDEMNEKAPVDDDGTVYWSGPNSRQGTTRKHRRFPLFPSRRGDLEASLESSDSHLNSSWLIGKQAPLSKAHHTQAVHAVTLDALKSGERVNVRVSPMFIFLFKDGTVISIHPAADLEFTAPISKRLHQRDTGLRSSADPSLLVHSLLDLIVDNALEVIDEYHTKINKFERTILLKPNMKAVTRLHILSGDLILHKRTLEPIKTMIYGLRRYDLDRCTALIDTSDPANANVKITGFMSHKSKIYLADVFDHMDYILTSLDMFTNISENLINYTFNIASYEMNEVMRRLTLATIIFLPLTLLTGYFGMNFESMWSVNNNSDRLFWEIAIPVMLVVIPLFATPDIRRIIHYIQKRTAAKQAVKAYKQA